MIKGINKQVLEIFETNNGYFEKALFFVKPEYSSYSENKLRELAQSEINNSLVPPLQLKALKKTKLNKIVISVLSFAAGIIAGLIFSVFV